MRQRHPLLLAAASLLLHSGCTFLRDAREGEVKNREVTVRALTGEIPELSEQTLPVPDFLTLPPELLRLKKINRPSTPLREGPGSGFPIQARLLSWGAIVAETDQYSVWRKVITIPELRTGWVHFRTLGDDTSYKNPVRLPGSLLPLRHTRRQLTEVAGFSDNQPVSATIPADRGLLQIRSEPTRTLLWIAETNSVAWFPKKHLY